MLTIREKALGRGDVFYFSEHRCPNCKTYMRSSFSGRCVRCYPKDAKFCEMEYDRVCDIIDKEVGKYSEVAGRLPSYFVVNVYHTIVGKLLRIREEQGIYKIVLNIPFPEEGMEVFDENGDALICSPLLTFANIEVRDWSMALWSRGRAYLNKDMPISQPRLPISQGTMGNFSSGYVCGKCKQDNLYQEYRGCVTCSGCRKERCRTRRRNVNKT
jgi:hypothetical protein